MDNSFEKQIRNKVGQTEVSPSADLFDAILEKRAARTKPFMGLGYTKLFLLTAIAAITAGVWYVNRPVSGDKTISQNSSTQMAPSNDAKLENTDNAADHQIAKTELAQEDVSKKTSAEGASGDSKSGKTHAVKSTKAAIAKADQNEKTKKAMKKIKGGFNGKPSWANADPSSYFDVDAANRPDIDYEKHQGNSHLFVYESVNPDQLENEILRYTNASRMSKIQYPFAFDAMSPVKADKTNYVVSGKHQKPLFIDLLFAQVYSTAKTSDAAANTLKNGTLNQQFCVRVSAPVKGRLSVFAGLGYMNQILHYRGDLTYNEAFTQINTKVTFINDPVKGVIRVETKDTVNGMASKTRAVDFKNTYSVFRMPVGLGYNFGLGKFDFTLYGSADINVLTSAVANSRIAEANPLISRTNNKSLHLGAGLSFMSAYRISPRFRLILEPGMHYMQLNSSKTGNFGHEKIYNFTGTLGLRYSLF